MDWGGTSCWKSGGQGSQHWRFRHESPNDGPQVLTWKLRQFSSISKKLPWAPSIFRGKVGGPWPPLEDSESHICPYIRLQLPLENDGSSQISCKSLSLASSTLNHTKKRIMGKECSLWLSGQYLQVVVDSTSEEGTGHSKLTLAIFKGEYRKLCFVSDIKPWKIPANTGRRKLNTIYKVPYT